MVFFFSGRVKLIGSVSLTLPERVRKIRKVALINSDELINDRKEHKMLFYGINERIAEANSFYSDETRSGSRPATDALSADDNRLNARVSACELGCGDPGSRFGGQIEILDGEDVVAVVAYSVDYEDANGCEQQPYGWLDFDINEGASIIVEELIAALEKVNVNTGALEEAIARGEHLLKGKGAISFYVEDNEDAPEEEEEEIDFHLFRKRNRRKVMVPVI